MSEVFSSWLKSFEIMTGSLLFSSKNAYSRCGGNSLSSTSEFNLLVHKSEIFERRLDLGSNDFEISLILWLSKSRKSLSPNGVSVGDEVETIRSKSGEDVVSKRNRNFQYLMGKVNVGFGFVGRERLFGLVLVFVCSWRMEEVWMVIGGSVLVSFGHLTFSISTTAVDSEFHRMKQPLLELLIALGFVPWVWNGSARLVSLEKFQRLRFVEIVDVILEIRTIVSLSS
ncbi:hypothetical protein Tco_0713666 [Tanacetum coccineum]